MSKFVFSRIKTQDNGPEKSKIAICFAFKASSGTLQFLKNEQNWNKITLFLHKIPGFLHTITVFYTLYPK